MLIPTEDRVVVRVQQLKDVTEGGIYIPKSAKEQPVKGTVVAVGDGLKDSPMYLDVGYDIVFQKFSGTEVEYKGEVFKVMRQGEALCVIPKEDDEE